VRLSALPSPRTIEGKLSKARARLRRGNHRGCAIARVSMNRSLHEHEPHEPAVFANRPRSERTAQPVALRLDWEGWR
jgi:hypothetical protein